MKQAIKEKLAEYIAESLDLKCLVQMAYENQLTYYESLSDAEMVEELNRLELRIENDEISGLY